MKNKKMMILENDKLTQIAYKRMFGNIFDLRIFGSADPFFVSFNEDPCDILLVDISLDGDLDGIEITKKIRENPKFKNLPIICITAHAFNKERVNAINAGVNEVVIKPIGNEELRGIIDAALAR